jgi:hypothetical protein
MKLAAVTCSLVLPLLATVASATAADEGAPAADSDPYVLLDAAKLKLGEGRLAKARELLAAIPLQAAEEYVDEEVLFQQLLINSAYLKATGYLLSELERDELAESAYARWLRGERDGYAATFARLAQQYLERTGGGPRLDFVRFRLPVVTAEHINDLELYSDVEILGPAVTNWDDGREGLGKGLIAGQARVALVLAAARYYDLPDAARSLEQVRQRLLSGVPLDYGEVLAWIAEEAAGQPADAALSAAGAAARQRLMQLDNPAGATSAVPEAKGATEQNTEEAQPSD